MTGTVRFVCSDPDAGDFEFADVEAVLDALEAALVQAATPIFDAAAAGTQAFTKWWNSAPVRGRRKVLRPDLDNLASIARAADQEIARERQAEAAARQQQLDQVRLDDPFGKSASPGDGAVERALPLKSVGDGRHPVSGAGA